MNPELRQDIAALTETVRRFTLDRIAPNVSAWDEAGEFPRELYREAAALGLLGLGYPRGAGRHAGAASRCATRCRRRWRATAAAAA